MISMLLALMTLSVAADSSVTAPMAPPPAATTPGPLTPGSFGLGFRALGEGPSIHISYAITDRKSIGLEATWTGYYEDYDNEATSSYRYPNYWDNTTSYTENKAYSNGEETRLGFRVAVPFETVLGCRQDVCITGSFGPMYQLSYIESQSKRPDNSFDGSMSYLHEERTTHMAGLFGSLGVRWEFVHGLSLSSSYGADAWRSFGDENSEYISATGYSRSTTEETHQGYGTSSWFGGIGLDAWF